MKDLTGTDYADEVVTFLLKWGFAGFVFGLVIKMGTTLFA